MKSLKASIETISDKDLEEKTLRLININLDEANLKLEYYEKYKKVISVKKIFTLHHSEKEFKGCIQKAIAGLESPKL